MKDIETYVQSFHGEDAEGSKIQYRQLGQTDMRVSHIGLGASAFGSVFRSTDDEEVADVLSLLLRAGVNYIDTAPWYGHGKSETVLGKALKEMAIPREAYYIATKVGRYDPDPANMFNFSYDRTLASVERSLSLLGLPYVDIIQVHDIEFAPSLDIVIDETLPALQKVKDAGKARYIGITGYPLSALKEVVERSTVKIDTVLTYCRYSLNDTTFLNYEEYFRSKGIGIINASPLSMGLLTTRGPPDWHPALLYTPDIASACKEASEYCESKGVDISRLSFHFSLEKESCATCLISTASRKNALKNLDVIAKPLSETELTVLKEMRERFMMPLQNANWEGYEREALKKGEFVG